MHPALPQVLWHLLCRKGIVSTLLMAWHIIKAEKACCKPICSILEDIDRLINLLDKIVSCKVSILILPSLEDNTGLSTQPKNISTTSS
jgi:hypothetical protein